MILKKKKYDLFVRTVSSYKYVLCKALCSCFSSKLTICSFKIYMAVYNKDLYVVFP